MTRAHTLWSVAGRPVSLTRTGRPGRPRVQPAARLGRLRRRRCWPCPPSRPRCVCWSGRRIQAVPQDLVEADVGEPDQAESQSDGCVLPPATPDDGHRQRCRVGDVVEGGPNAGAGQVAQCGQVREQQCHRDEPPGHAARGVGDQRAREQRGGLEVQPPARLTDNGSARRRVLPPRVGVPPVTPVTPVQSVLRPSQRGSSRPLARSGRSFGRYRQAGQRRRGWVLPE